MRKFTSTLKRIQESFYYDDVTAKTAWDTRGVPNSMKMMYSSEVPSVIEPIEDATGKSINILGIFPIDSNVPSYQARTDKAVVAFGHISHDQKNVAGKGFDFEELMDQENSKEEIDPNVRKSRVMQKLSNDTKNLDEQIETAVLKLDKELGGDGIPFGSTLVRTSDIAGICKVPSMSDMPERMATELSSILGVPLVNLINKDSYRYFLEQVGITEVEIRELLSIPKENVKVREWVAGQLKSNTKILRKQSKTSNKQMGTSTEGTKNMVVAVIENLLDLLTKHVYDRKSHNISQVTLERIFDSPITLKGIAVRNDENKAMKEQPVILTVDKSQTENLLTGKRYILIVDDNVGSGDTLHQIHNDLEPKLEKRYIPIYVAMYLRTGAAKRKVNKQAVNVTSTPKEIENMYATEFEESIIRDASGKPTEVRLFDSPHKDKILQTIPKLVRLLEFRNRMGYSTSSIYTTAVSTIVGALLQNTQDKICRGFIISIADNIKSKVSDPRTNTMSHKDVRELLFDVVQYINGNRDKSLDSQEAGVRQKVSSIVFSKIVDSPLLHKKVSKETGTPYIDLIKV